MLPPVGMMLVELLNLSSTVLPTVSFLSMDAIFAVVEGEEDAACRLVNLLALLCDTAKQGDITFRLPIVLFTTVDSD